MLDKAAAKNAVNGDINPYSSATCRTCCGNSLFTCQTDCSARSANFALAQTIGIDCGARFGDRVQLNRPLADLTSFRIGGPADLFLMVEDADELSYALAAAYRQAITCFFLGSGTNLLVSDRGVRGLVVIQRPADPSPAGCRSALPSRSTDRGAA